MANNMCGSTSKISVIIPVYNVEQYLEACLISVVSQTLREIEIICINDGSLDKSIYILNRYAEEDERIKVITQANGGLSVARNSGLREATGEYIYFLDSDDYLATNDALSLMYESVYIEKIDILSFNHRTIGLEEEIYLRAMPHGDVLDGKTYLQHNGMWSVMVWLRLYRRAYLTSIDFSFTPNITSEDDEALPRLYFDAEKVKHIKDVLLVYRRRDDSISTSPTSQRLIDGLVTIVKTYFVLAKREPEPGFNKYLFSKALEYLFILYKKIFSVKDQQLAVSKYNQLLQESDFTPFERRLLKNEEKFIIYRDVEKKEKKHNLSVYYTRRFRILYFKYIRKYGDNKSLL